MKQARRLRRRALIQLPLALLLAVAAITAARYWLVPLPLHSQEYQVFGTLVQVDIRSRNQAAARAALADIGRLLEHNHRAWHAWDPASELSQINARLARGESAQAAPDLAEMIRYAQEGYRRSEGLFDAALGKLIHAWGFHDSHYPLQTAAPSAAAVQQHLAQRPSMADVDISRDGVVSAANPNVALDLNGLAEGYAAQQIAALLQARGLRHALIYVGGYVLALGEAEGRPWRAGVRAPQGGLLGQVDLKDGEALSSSGDYKRYRPTESGREGHILDPRAGRPQRQAIAASVLSDDPVWADMAATALMVAGPTGFERIARSMGMGCALLVGGDGELLLTPAMLQRLELEPGSLPVRLSGEIVADCRRPD